MIKKIVVVASLGLATIVLTACGAQEDSVIPEGNIGYIEIDTPNGPVPCVGWNSTRSAALSCNWEVEK